MLAAQELVQRTLRVTLGWLPRLLWRMSRRGHQSVPRRGAVIVAFNHASFLDPVLVSVSIPRPLHYLGKDVVLGGGAVRSFVLRHLSGQIALRDDGGNAGALMSAIAMLKLGSAVAIAPEGTRSPDGEIHRARTGVARLAYATGAPIYPVALAGAFEAWPRSRRWPRLFVPISVTVGDPIVVERDAAAFDDPRRCRMLADEVMGAIAELLDKPYQPAQISSGSHTASASRAAEEASSGTGEGSPPRPA
jgi:1-acyl-sn-glycerol-3-phosphate acyltransferase